MEKLEKKVIDFEGEYFYEKNNSHKSISNKCGFVLKIICIIICFLSSFIFINNLLNGEFSSLVLMSVFLAWFLTFIFLEKIEHNYNNLLSKELDCSIEFGEETLVITYKNIMNVQNLETFDEIIEIRYADIESILCEEEIDYFEFKTRFRKVRVFHEKNKEDILSDFEETSDICLFVNTKNEEIRKLLSGHVSCIVDNLLD